MSSPELPVSCVMILFLMRAFRFVFVPFLLPAIMADTETQTDTLLVNNRLRDGQTLVSVGQRFEFGFYSPNCSSSTGRYLGIWYKNLPLTVVWVANMDNPIRRKSPYLELTNSALLLHNGTNNIRIVGFKEHAKTPVLQILDSGNLVLKDNGAGYEESYLWESFDYPCDTLLPGMKLGWNLTAGINRSLKSWTANDDPSTGDYTFGLEWPEAPQLVLSKGKQKLNRWGPWNGVRFSGSNELKGNQVFQPIFLTNHEESYYRFEMVDNSILMRIYLPPTGRLEYHTWRSNSKEWDTTVAFQRDSCDRYNTCGPYGNCYSNDPNCQCLQGFTPKSPEDWYKYLDRSSGCARNWPINCGKGEGFMRFDGLKLPDYPHVLSNISHSDPEDCAAKCLKDCFCTAYSNINIMENGNSCLLWYGDLIDLRNFSSGGDEIYIRMAKAELDSISDEFEKKALTAIIIIVAAATPGVVLLAVVLYLICNMDRMSTRSYINLRMPFHDIVEDTVELELESLELHLFDLASISAATNHFSLENKIGQGGFGQVYKGTLAYGQEIAVKRLSRHSGQGLQEFKNEVMFISNLQHRNLVRLLGCCIEGEDRMLIYEYLPNKSLDRFLFDNDRKKLLTWEKRFNIVLGTARGLLYLHQDSRLRIIHRDLKTSNILLDNDMNPKISDFGVARTFVGDQTEETTRAVIGTHGYMAPEYAFSGLFSVKSDVFSFGVLLLEIVSGKRNWRFSHPDHDFNLIGHAWKLWNEGKASALIDEAMEGSFSEDEVMKCIQVGLVCVQQHPEDRPMMCSVALMLSNESSVVPEPKEPGFVAQTSYRGMESRQTSNTINDITFTALEGR